MINITSCILLNNLSVSHFIVAVEMGLLSRCQKHLSQAAEWNPDGGESLLQCELF